MKSTELIPSASIDALLGRRAAMVERLELANRALIELGDLGNAAFGKHYEYKGLSLRDQHHNAFPSENGLKAAVAQVDAAGWDWLLYKSGLRSFMDAKTRGDWDDLIYKGKTPKLDRETILATFAELYQRRGEMFDQGVIRVFRSLSWDYATNNPYRFGKRIIVNYVAATYKGEFTSGVEHNAANKLDDLIRVFSMLDGKPEPDHRNGCYWTMQRANWPLETNPIELAGYLRVKGFRNSNAHITFLRQDLVDGLNAIIAKHYPGALPAKKDRKGG